MKFKAERHTHQVICNDYPLYEGESYQDALQEWIKSNEEGLSLDWYYKGNLYRSSKRPVAVA